MPQIHLRQPRLQKILVDRLPKTNEEYKNLKKQRFTIYFLKQR